MYSPSTCILLLTMFSSFTPSALLTYLQSNHIHSPLIQPSHLVVALCSVCCLILWWCLTLKKPFEAMHSHITLGTLVSLFFYFKKNVCPFPLSICPLHYNHSLLCHFFFGTFLHLLWCLLLIAISPTLFFFFFLMSILLLAPYYFAIAHVLMVITTHPLCFTLSWCSTWSFASTGICCVLFI